MARRPRPEVGDRLSNPGQRAAWRARRVLRGVPVALVVTVVGWGLVLGVNGITTRLMNKGTMLDEPLPAAIAAGALTFACWLLGALRLPPEGTRRPTTRAAGPAPLPVQRFVRPAAPSVTETP